MRNDAPGRTIQVDGAGRSNLDLVLLHAFPLTSAMWQAQAGALRGAARVWRPDLFGFGTNLLPDDDSAGEPSLDRMADDVAAYLDSYELGRVVLGGLSMGGYVAMAFARRHPDRLSGLVLADTKASADPEQAAANRRRIADLLESSGSTDVLIDEVFPGLLGETTKALRPMVVAQVRSMVTAAAPAGAAWAQRAMAARPNSLETLRALDIPALVIRGDQDALSSAQDTQAMVDALPQGRLVVVPDAGHLAAMENPAPVTSAIAAFMAGLS